VDVDVSASPSDGIVVGAKASATLRRVQVHDVKGYGIKAFDSGDLTLDEVTLATSGGPGAWLQCGNGCDCPARPRLTMRKVVAHDNTLVGVSLSGVETAVDGIEIADTHSEGASMVGLPVGLVARDCAKLEGQSVSVVDNDPFDASHGIIIDGAGAKLG